jgi:hypothetical protein
VVAPFRGADTHRDCDGGGAWDGGGWDIDADCRAAATHIDTDRRTGDIHACSASGDAHAHTYAHVHAYCCGAEHRTDGRAYVDAYSGASDDDAHADPCV